MPNTMPLHSFRPRLRRAAIATVLGSSVAVAALALGGCTNVPVYAQSHVSRPGMTFSESLVETQRLNLVSQLEPGAAVSGGAQAAGCTACR